MNQTEQMTAAQQIKLEGPMRQQCGSRTHFKIAGVGSQPQRLEPMQHNLFISFKIQFLSRTEANGKQAVYIKTN